jgi:hypothetical protein
MTPDRPPRVNTFTVHEIDVLAWRELSFPL